MSVAIVTACDKNMYELLQGLILSLREQAQRPIELCFLDIGLTVEQRRWVSARVDHICEPRKDLMVPTSHRPEPYMQAQICRPFLREYFPGHDCYFWIDADVWVQDGQALEDYMIALDDPKGRLEIAIAPELHRSYRLIWPEAGTIRRMRYREFEHAFDRRVAAAFCDTPMLNSGVFCAPHDSPFWQRYSWALQVAFQSPPRHLSEQIAANYAVLIHYHPRKKNLKAALMPATHNWMCHYALPTRDPNTGHLTTPDYPHHKLGFVHLAGKSKREKYRQLGLLYRSRSDQGVSGAA